MDRDDLPDLTPKPRRHVLSICGGGYAGLFAAEFLTHLEGEVGRSSEETFDMFAGTSIGGLIALGLARGMTATQVSTLLQDVGPKLFSGSKLPLVRPRYDVAALRTKLVEVFGKARLRDVVKAVLVPAVDLTSAAALVFSNDPNGPTANELLVDVALATSAAPVFLAPHESDSRLFGDGGLVANSPEALAALEALNRRRWGADNVTMLVVGSTLNCPRVPGHLLGADWGIGRWLSKGRLTSVTMSAQMTLARHMASGLLGHDRIVVADVVLSTEEARIVSLDKADAASTAALKTLASTCFHRFKSRHPAYLRSLRT